MSRGYFGIGIYQGKTEHNIGTLWRTAHLYGAAYIFTVGKRYQRQASDTPNTRRHTPMFEFADIDDLKGHLPYSCPLIGVDQPKKWRGYSLTAAGTPDGEPDVIGHLCGACASRVEDALDERPAPDLDGGAA